MPPKDAGGRWVEFGGAIACGLAISFYFQYSLSFVKPMWDRASDFQLTAIYVASYILGALIVIWLKRKFDTRFGWVLIATLGALFCASFDEWSRRSDPDGIFMDIYVLPINLVVYSLIALPIMGLCALLQGRLRPAQPSLR